MKLPPSSDPTVPWQAFVVRSAGFRVEMLRHGFTVAPSVEQLQEEQGWDELMAANSAELLEAFEDDRLQQATIWQDASVVAEILPRARGPRASRARRCQPMLARYLQRYVLRNESVGFFGPVFWGSLESGGANITHRPGADPEVRTEAVLESWAVAALAEALVESGPLRESFPVTLRVEAWHIGRYLVRGSRRHTLSTAQRAVVTELSGPSYPRRTVRELAAATGLDLEEVVDAVGELAAAEFIHWGPDLPPAIGELAALRAQVTRLADSPERDHAARELERMDAAIELAGAARSAAELDERFHQAATLFSAVTARRADRVIAPDARGRQIMGLMGERTGELRVGGQLADDIVRLLQLLRPVARWLAFAAGEAVEAAARDARQVAGDADEVPLGLVYAGLAAVVWEPEFMTSVIAELRQRWHRVWQGGGDDDQPLDDVRARAEEEFAAPLPCWASGAEHSPDLMVAARDIAAANRGEYRLILGELHVGTVTADQVPFTWAGDGARLVEREYARSRGSQARFVPAYVNDFTYNSALNYPPPEVGDSAHTLSLVVGPTYDIRQPDPDRFVRMSECTVIERNGRLRVRTPIGEYGLLEVLGEMASQAASSSFNLVPPGTGRRTVDGRIVLNRASWACATEDLQELIDDSSRMSCVRVRRHLESLGVARWSFWRAGNGVKPIYLDLWNALYLRVFVQMVRRLDPSDVPHVVLTEMDPDVNHAWLPHPDGGTVTSELRVTMVDRQAP